jgi:hypothetical protein
MAIADAVIITRKKISKGKLLQMLSSLNGVDVTGIHDKGITVIL